MFSGLIRRQRYGGVMSGFKKEADIFLISPNTEGKFHGLVVREEMNEK